MGVDAERERTGVGERVRWSSRARAASRAGSRELGTMVFRWERVETGESRSDIWIISSATVWRA